jgi:predicted dinucleotide-binding enzyme
MEIGILGMGRVGTTLGRRWAAAGHHITFGVRDPERRRDEARELGAGVGTLRDAAAAGVVLLAVPFAAAFEVLIAAGDLSGKVLLDATNPVTPDLDHLTLGFTISSGEEVARCAAGERVEKVFNTNGVGNLADPDYGGQQATIKELAAKMVKLVSAMFGAYKLGGVNRHREYNVVEDLPATKKFAAEWPTPIVFSGFEVGQAVTFPAASIEQDFGYAKRHPLAEAYRRTARRRTSGRAGTSPVCSTRSTRTGGTSASPKRAR